jgi:hypothetical protein
MSAIVWIKGMPGTETMFTWLKENTEDYIASGASVTFFHDEDAVAFMLRFGAINATYNPQILNRSRDEKSNN